MVVMEQLLHFFNELVAVVVLVKLAKMVQVLKLEMAVMALQTIL